MAIIGVAGAEGIGSLIPDRATLKKKLVGIIESSSVVGGTGPVLNPDGTVNRAETVLKYLNFARGRVGLEAYPSPPDFGSGDLEALVSEYVASLVASFADQGVAPPKPVVAVFLDP